MLESQYPTGLRKLVQEVVGQRVVVVLQAEMMKTRNGINLVIVAVVCCNPYISTFVKFCPNCGAGVWYLKNG